MSCYETALVLLCLLAASSSVAQTCGKRKKVNHLMVNGTESQDGNWPWHVAIFHNDGLSFVYACGGTILDQNTVLTAAHCVMTPNGVVARERLVVQVGRNRLRVGSNRVQEHDAFQLIVHPEYSVNSIQHDIALIKLATDITYTDYIQPICLWNRGEDLNAIVGTKATVVGFGIDETGDVSDTLREATIPVVSHMTCIESNWTGFRSQLTSNMFCAGNRDGISACNGDSGGGLFFNYSGVWYIRGVVSFTKPHQDTLLCDTKEYTVFTDVAKHLRWIERHMRGTADQPVVKGIDTNSKIRLLPVSTCGESSSESLKLGDPWIGELLYTATLPVRKFWNGRCLATLISDFYLVTTARCITEIGVRYTLSSVRLGEFLENSTSDCSQGNRERVCSPSSQELRIESVTTHRDFNKENYENDIALIRLRDRADTSRSNVKPICLPVTTELQSYYLSIITTSISLDGRFQTTMLSECRNQINGKCFEEISTSLICVNHDHDHTNMQLQTNGAPLQLRQEVNGKHRIVLYGVLSFINATCNPLFPKVFSDVPNYMDWILENIKD